MITISFNAIQNIILIFPEERAVFLREHSNGMYSVSAYFFSKVTSELPANIIFPALFGIIVYFPLNLSTDPSSKFGVFRKHARLIRYVSRLPYTLLHGVVGLRSDHQFARL